MYFQVHQTKKSNKFQCKICGEKQSIKRHYGLGNGQECRLHVQKLNGIRSNFDEVNLKGDSESEEEILQEVNNVKDFRLNSFHHPKRTRNSKWSTFVEDDENKEIKDNDSETMYLGDTEVVLDIPSNHKNLGSSKIKSKIDTSNVSKQVYKPQANSYLDTEIQSEHMSDTSVYNIKSKYIPIEKSDHRGPSEDINNILKNSNKTGSNLTLSLINKNSKWAKYSEKIDHHSDVCNSLIIDCTETQKNVVHKTIHNNIFSLSEDDNLDSILEL